MKLMGRDTTCKRVGVDVQDYLSLVFIQRGTHRDTYQFRAADLTPAADQRSLAATA